MKRLGRNKSPLVSNSRWLAYATAGAASTLSGAHSAEGEIHYSGEINSTVHHHGGSKRFPLLHSARLHFIGYTYNWDFSISGAAVSNNVCGYTTTRFGFPYVSRLRVGAVISNCAFLAQSGTRALLFDFYGGGQFSDGGIGFIGFRFNNGAGVQYGWARLRTQGHFEEGFKLLDYAWGDPGDQVRAGQTSLAGGQVEATPDHGSLGLLAIGGAGLIAWRKQRAPMCGEN